MLQPDKENYINRKAVSVGLPSTPIVGDVGFNKAGRNNGEPAQNISALDMWDQALAAPKQTGVADIPVSSFYTGTRYKQTLPGTDYEEMAAQGQSAGEKWANASLKLVGTAATSFISGTVGLVAGIGSAVKDQRLASLIDNPVTREMDDVMKYMEDYAPNYYSHQEKDAKWWSPDNILTANFWSDKVLKNLGYSVGAIGGGVAWGSLFRSIGLTNKLVQAGRGMEAATAIESSMSAVPNMQKLNAFETALNSLSQKYIKSPISSVLKDSDRILTSTMGTFGEASMEGLQGMNKYRQDAIDEYKSIYGVDPTGEVLDKINKSADQVGMYIWGANSILLTGTNYVQLPKILGSSRKADRALINSIEKDAETGLFKQVLPATKFGRIAQKVKGVSQVLFAPTEAFEEGMQFSIETGVNNYFKRARQNKQDTSEFLSTLNGAMQNVFGEGIHETLTTKEGMESIIIGGISGGIQQGGIIGTYRNDKGQTRIGIGKSGVIAEQGLFGTGGERQANTDVAVSALNKSNIQKQLKDGVKYLGIGIGSQKLRQDAIANNDVLSEKDYEADFTLSYLMPRIKYGKVDSIKEELDLYKSQAMNPEGFRELVRGGIANENETSEQFLTRINNLQKLSNDVEVLYDKINDKYKNDVNDKGEIKYTDDVIDKLVYSAAKIKDYDARIPGVSNSIIGSGVDLQSFLNALFQREGSSIEDITKALATIDALDVTNDEKKDFRNSLYDLAELSLRRKEMIDQYNDILDNPNNFKEEEEPDTLTKEELLALPEGRKIDEEGNVIPNKKIISVKTKSGMRDLEIGTEYYVGRSTAYSITGKEVYSPGVIKILGENEDGTLRIEDQDGNIKNITKEQFANAEPSDYRKALLDKKFKWFISNWNTMFKHFNIKVNGQPAIGRLSWSPKEGKLIFKYKDAKGKVQQKEVTRRDFVINNAKYKHPMVMKVGELTAADIQANKELADSVDERDEAAIQDHFKVLAELYDELVDKKSKTDALINRKTNEVESLKKEFTTLEEKIKNAQGDKRSKTVFKFKSETRKALSAAMRLSKTQEQLQEELQNLETDREEIESNINYVSDLLERVEELPNDNFDLLVELDEQKKNLKEVYSQVGKEINALSKVLKAVEDALKYAINLVHDLIKSFESKYPKTPNILGQEWVTFLKENPNFLKLKPEYRDDLARTEDLVAQIEDLDIIPNERSIVELNDSIAELQNQLKNIDQELKNRDVVMQKFEKVIEAYEQQQLEEQKMRANKALKDKFLGTNSKIVQNKFGKQNYEATPKKSWKSVVGGTIAVMGEEGEEIREHHKRAQRFGNRFTGLKNKEAINGVVIVNNTQADLIPGLTEHLVGETGLNPKDVIALAMVQKNANGSIVLVDEFGKPIEGKTETESVEEYKKRLFDSAIYQVFPSDKLEQTYIKDGKKVKETMFRVTTPDNVKADLTKKYQDWRTQQLKQTSLSAPQSIDASFGIPEYVTYTNDLGKEERDFAARTPATQTKLISNKSLRTEPCVIVATTNNSITNGSVSFEAPEGRVFLKVGDEGLAKLQNRQFTKQEAVTLFDVIKQVAENSLNEGDIANSKRLFNWLNSVVYWGIPKTPEGAAKESGYNSIFFKEVDGQAKLFISGLGESFDFTPMGLENRKNDIIALLQQMYNNTDATLVREENYNNKYSEITGIDKDGNPITRTWQNYQTYLLSDKLPNQEGVVTDESEPRDINEIPLVTQIKPITREGETNRKGIYFTLKNTVDTYGEQAATPVVQAPAPTAAPAPAQQTPTQQAPVAPAPAPSSPPSGYVLDGRTENEVLLGADGIYGKVYVSFDGKRFLDLWNKDKFDPTTDPKKTAELVTKLITEKILNFTQEVSGVTADNIKNLLSLDSQEQALDVIKTIVFKDKMFPVAIEKSIVKVDPMETSTTTAENNISEVKSAEEIEETAFDDQDVLNEMEQNILDNPIPDDALYRLKLVKEATQFTPEKWDKVEEDFAKMLPNVPLYRVKNMIDATNGRQAWGMFHKAAVYVYENAEVGTVYHEVFEAVWKMFAGPIEKQSIVKEFKNREGSYFDEFQQKEIKYSEATDQEIKEQLAEEFRDAVLNDKLGRSQESKSLISRLFNQLIEAIKAFFVGPNAQKNTQELFNKIGEGYYAKYNPYESNLSYANVGIQDIEDAAGDETSEFSIAKIPAAQQHDIVQHMTFATLRDMVRTNQSLFEISSLPKKQLYESLKKEVLYKISFKTKQLSTALKKNEVSAQQIPSVTRDVNNLINLYKNVKKNWDKIQEKHEEQLKTFSIEFDENDSLILNDENKSGKADWQNARMIDGFRKANSAVKILLASLPETELVDGKVRPILSSIGGFTLMDASKVYINLKEKLHDSIDTDDMFNRLRDMALANPNYETLYYRMTKKVATEGEPTSLLNLGTNDINLISAFFSAMKSQNADAITVFVLPNGETVVSDSTLTSAAKQSQRDLENSIKDVIKSDKSPYFTYNGTTGKYKTISDIDKAPLTSNNLGTYVTFLKNIGVEFKESELDSKLSNNQLATFRKAVEGIKKSLIWLSKSPKNEEDTSAIEGLVNINSRTLDISGQLFQLGVIKSILENPEYESTYFNLNGDRTQTHTGVNVMSRLYDTLSRATNINQLDGTDSSSSIKSYYSYLLTDTFSKGSVMLRKMFDLEGEGDRIKYTEDLMKPVFVDGLVNEQTGKKKESSKLTQRQRYIQEFNLNLNGIYINLVSGGAANEYALKMHEASSPLITENEILENGHHKIFERYFIDEVDLARENRNIQEVKGRKKSDLRFFKDILGGDLHKDITSKINKNLSSQEVYNKYKGDINSALDKFINQDVKDTITTLKDYKILTGGELGFDINEIEFSNKENITQKTLNDNIKTVTINYMIANIEMHKLIYSDPYQYKDELKRIKNFSSPKQAILYGSSQFNTSLHNAYNEGYDINDIGHTDFIRDNFRAGTLSDVWANDESLDKYNEPYEETDGGGYISLRAARVLRLHDSTWTVDNERQYRYDIAFEKQVKAQDLSMEEIQERGLNLSMDEVDLLDAGNPGVKSTYTPIKPIAAGSKTNGRSYNDIVLHKFALVPFSFRILHELNSESNAIKLYNKMQREDVDYVVYASGSKVGAEKTLNLYDEDGNFNEAPFETDYERQNVNVPQGITNIPFSIFGIQSEVPSKDTTDVTQGSQVTKLATLDLFEAGVPATFLQEVNDINKRYEEWNRLTPEQKEENKLYKELINNQNILEAKNKNGYNALLRKLGIKKTKDGFVLSNPDRLSNTLRDQLAFQEINENIIDALKGFKKGQVVLEATPAYRQIKNVLYSIADKNITSQKITGGMKVQIPSSLLESVKAKAKEVNGKLVYQSKELKFYRNADGERVCEIMLPRWFNSPLSDEKLLEYLNNTDEGKKILQGISFRIPTQKQNSIDVFRIAKFLPKEFGDSVVVPSQLVKKSGSDFDIDKLSIYLKNVVKQGSKLKAVEFLTDKNSKIEQRYYDWIVESSDKDTTKYIKFLTNSRVKEIKDAFKTQLNALNDKYKTDVASKKDELFKTYEDDLNITLKELVTDQEEGLKNLFDTGKKVFYRLSYDAREDYFNLRDKMIKENINGPKEIENYLALTINKLQTLKNAEDIDTSNDLITLYTQQLRMLGETDTFLKQFKELALTTFRNSKKVEIEKINDVTSKMSDEIKDRESEEMTSINLEVAKELAEANELPTLEEFKKFDIYDQNTKKALENAYIESLENLVAHPVNFNRLTKPNSAEDMKNLAKKINKQIGKVETDYSNVGNMLKRTFMNPLRQDFVGGSYAIGIAAVGQTGLSQRQRGVITINRNRLDDGTIDPIDAEWLGDGRIKFKNYNKIKVNGEERPSLSGVKSAGTDTDISDINSQLMDGYVDIEKDPWIMDLGAKPNVAPTYLLLLGLGVPVESVSYFIKQPIIQDYLRDIENNGYSWLFIQDYVDEAKDKYEPSKSYKDTGAKVVEIPSDTDLFKMLAFSDPNNTKEMSDLQKAQQQFMLDEFTKYAMMANHMFTVTQATNYDTATLNDSMSIFQKKLQLEKARKTIISSADYLLDSSFVGPLKDILFDVRDAFSTVEISDRTKNSSGGATTRQVMEAVLTPYALSTTARDFTKISQKAKTTLFDWAMQTDRNQNQYLQRILLGTSTEESAAKQIMSYVDKIKADKDHPLNKNLVINSLKMESGSKMTSFTKNDKVYKLGKQDNLYLNGRDNKVYMQNQIINSFEEIKQDLLKTNKDLYGKLIRVAILQSGLATSPISFTQLLPYEDFVTIYNDTLSKLENMPNLATFSNMDVFERANWSDTNITPYKKATLRQDKNGDLYNINEKFINQGLKNAMDKDLIPKVINISKLSSEGRSDIIVYSWESRISKAEKIRARKAGDTSYINKALMKKVYKSDGTPLIQRSEYNGRVYENYIYKAINAWGDSYRAQEYYNLEPVEDEQGNIVGYSAPASKLDNGFVKVEKVTDSKGNIIRYGEVEDSVIEEIYNNGTSPATEGNLMLKNGLMYTPEELNPQMLSDIGYDQADVDRLMKLAVTEKPEGIEQEEINNTLNQKEDESKPCNE